MEISRQEYWSGLPFPSPCDLPDPGIEPRSPALQADSLPSKLPGKPSKLWISSLLQDLNDFPICNLRVYQYHRAEAERTEH